MTPATIGDLIVFSEEDEMVIGRVLESPQDEYKVIVVDSFNPTMASWSKKAEDGKQISVSIEKIRHVIHERVNGVLPDISIHVSCGMVSGISKISPSKEPLIVKVIDSDSESTKLYEVTQLGGRYIGSNSQNENSALI